MSDTSGTLLHLPTSSLQANPLQPRGMITKDSLTELIDSIKQHGVLEPLVAAQTPAGYQLIAGERRWRAATLAGIETVPVVVKKTSPKGMLEMAIVENVQRTDLNPIDRAKAFERLMVEFGHTNIEIAKKVSKSAPYVSNSLRLLSLPDALKDGLISGAITEGHARALAAIDDNRQMVEAYKLVLREGASVRKAEEIARRYKQANRTIDQVDGSKPNDFIVSQRLDKIERDILKSMGKKSKVKLVQSRRQARLQITFNGSPDITQEKIDAVYKVLKDLNLS